MKKKLIIILGILVIGVFVVTSCASKKPVTQDTKAADLKAANAKVADLEGQLKAKDQKISDLEMEIASVNEELMDLQGRLAETQETADDLEIQVVSKEEEIAALEENIYELESTLELTGGDEMKTIVRLNQEKQQLEKQLSSLRMDLDAANSEIDDLYDEIDSLEAELDDMYASEESDKARMRMTRDELVSSLEQEIEDMSIEIEMYKDALTIRVMDQIFFDSGKATIKKTGQSVLDRVAQSLNNMPDKIIQIEGHTDDVPIGPNIRSKYPTNWELGAARASAVARYFIDKHGIDPTRFDVISYSKYQPLYPNVSEEYRAKNRRIEIVLTNEKLYELLEEE